MKQKTVCIIATLAIISLLLQTSPTQARPILTSSVTPSQSLQSKVDLLLPEGLTNLEWQNIQNQIMANLSQQAYLKASNTNEYDNFGYSVAISGDTLVVGAYSEDSSATDVNGDENDNTAPEAGAAYVFVRSGSTWSQQAYLKASNTNKYDNFGSSVAISGDTLVVGALGENSLAIYSGAAYVFVRSGTNWSQQAYLKASKPDTIDYFGSSVAISGDTIVIGAAYEDSNATDVNGDETNNSATNSGAAYVFVRSNDTWSQNAYLKASNTELNDHFGISVAISGDTLVVGANGEDSNTIGVNGVQINNSAPESGTAYVFVRSAGFWSQQAYLKASNTEASDYFGMSVAISGDTLVVGAYCEDSSATDVNGDETNNGAPEAGAAYVFLRNGETWSQQAYLKASNAESSDFFGRSVAISADMLVIGAPYESSNATGFNGDQINDDASMAGATYVFVRGGSTWTQETYLKSSNTDAGDKFGVSVSVSGDTLVVGAPYEDSSAADVNGDQSDNSASDSGAAYVYKITYKLFLPLITR